MSEAKQRANWERMSMLCALNANCHSTKRKFEPKDFNPFARANESKEAIKLDRDAAKAALRSMLGKRGSKK